MSMSGSHTTCRLQTKLGMKSMVHLATGAFLLWLLLSCSQDGNQSDNSPAQQPPTQQPPTQAAAPATIQFNAQDIDGNLRSSTEWIGKQPVVLNVWGTWCPPCRKEIPDLVRLYEEYHPRGIEIIGLAVRDTPQRVRQFAQQNGMGWVLLMGNEAALTPLGRITGVPTTIFLDKDGREIGRFSGFRSYDDFQKAFDLLLESSQS